MKTIKIALLLVAFLAIQCTSPEQQPSDSQSSMTTEAKVAGQASVVDDVSANNIVKVAVGSPDHTTLVTAVQAAGLVDVLANPGPFTVFAPTNEAFAALPDGTVDNLLKPENKMTLVDIIQFHVTPGTYKGNLLKDGFMLGQAQGDKLAVEVQEDGTVTVGGAKILATIEATNGVVHVVDKVLLPPEKM